MEKGGRLTKLKSVLKKWNSFGKLARLTHATSMVAAAASTNSSDDDEFSSSSYKISRDPLYPVYVGKSRRRYLVTSDIIDNPVFRELVVRSGDNATAGDSNAVITVDCEVVLFEHLLWMLENADHEECHPETLVEYYAC